MDYMICNMRRLRDVSSVYDTEPIECAKGVGANYAFVAVAKTPDCAETEQLYGRLRCCVSFSTLVKKQKNDKSHLPQKM